MAIETVARCVQRLFLAKHTRAHTRTPTPAPRSTPGRTQPSHTRCYSYVYLWWRLREGIFENFLFSTHSANIWKYNQVLDSQCINGKGMFLVILVSFVFFSSLACSAHPFRFSTSLAIRIHFVYFGDNRLTKMLWSNCYVFFFSFFVFVMMSSRVDK